MTGRAVSGCSEIQYTVALRASSHYAVVDTAAPARKLRVVSWSIMVHLSKKMEQQPSRAPSSRGPRLDLLCSSFPAPRGRRGCRPYSVVQGCPIGDLLLLRDRFPYLPSRFAWTAVPFSPCFMTREARSWAGYCLLDGLRNAHARVHEGSQREFLSASSCRVVRVETVRRRRFAGPPRGLCRSQDLMYWKVKMTV